MSPNLFIPQDPIERGLTMLPKGCNCLVCKLQKAEAKVRLGEERYNLISTQIGLEKEDKPSLRG